MRNQGKAFFLFFFFDNHECALNALIATFCLTVREKKKGREGGKKYIWCIFTIMGKKWPPGRNDSRKIINLRR